MKSILTAIFLLTLLQANSQQYFSIGISVSGIAFHPAANENTNYYKHPLDKNNKFTFYGGIAFYCNWHINEYCGIRLAQMILPYDCAGKFSGITQIGINLTDRIIGFKNETHRLNGTFGPMWYYRKDWMKVSGYHTDEKFCKLSNSGRWERKFIWYAGHAEYNYFYQKNQATSLIIFPGYPHLYTALAGFSYRN